MRPVPWCAALVSVCVRMVLMHAEHARSVSEKQQQGLPKEEMVGKMVGKLASKTSKTVSTRLKPVLNPSKTSL